MRKRLLRVRRSNSTLSRDLLALLRDEPPPEDGNVFTRIRFTEKSGEIARRYWLDWGEVVLLTWIIDHPGTRPSLWWKFSAPRVSPQRAAELARHGWGDAARRFHQPRLMVGGSGKVDSSDPRCFKGMPLSWEVLNCDDLPRFESELAYLRRHNLLLPTEAVRLRRASFRNSIPESELLPTFYVKPQPKETPPDEQRHASSP